MEHNRVGAPHAMASCRFTLSPGDTPGGHINVDPRGKIRKATDITNEQKIPCKFGNGMK